MVLTDQLGNTLSFSCVPKKIISIVPSQTELLFDLGLDKEVAGITTYCVHPKDWHETKTKIGGTKRLNLKKIKELNPDLIIGNKEENEKEQILELMKYYPVWMSDVKTMEDALCMINAIGKITEEEKKSLKIQNDIREQFAHFKLSTQNLQQENRHTAYFIWKKPYICAGANTFIDQMLQICGLKNAFSSISRYPAITKEQIKKANPSLIFLSSEPYPFREKHVQEFQGICPKAKIILVDGEMFSWYGSRLLYAPSYLGMLLQNL